MSLLLILLGCGIFRLLGTLEKLTHLREFCGCLSVTRLSVVPGFGSPCFRIAKACLALGINTDVLPMFLRPDQFILGLPPVQATE